MRSISSQKGLLKILYPFTPARFGHYFLKPCVLNPKAKILGRTIASPAPCIEPGMLRCQSVIIRRLLCLTAMLLLPLDWMSSCVCLPKGMAEAPHCSRLPLMNRKELAEQRCFSELQCCLKNLKTKKRHFWVAQSRVTMVQGPATLSKSASSEKLLADVQKWHSLEAQNCTLVVTALEARGMQPRKGTCLPAIHTFTGSSRRLSDHLRSDEGAQPVVQNVCKRNALDCASQACTGGLQHQ